MIRVALLAVILSVCSAIKSPSCPIPDLCSPRGESNAAAIINNLYATVYCLHATVFNIIIDSVSSASFMNYH